MRLSSYRLVLVPATPLGPLTVPPAPAFELAVVHARQAWFDRSDTVLNIRGLELGATAHGELRGVAERTVNFEADLISGRNRAWGTARLALDHLGTLDCQWAGTLEGGSMWACQAAGRFIAGYSIGESGSVPVGPIDLAISWAEECDRPDRRRYRSGHGRSADTGLR